MSVAEFRRKRRTTQAMRRAARLLGRKRRGKSRDKWKGIGLAAAATAVGGAGLLALKKRKDGKSKDDKSTEESRGRSGMASDKKQDKKKDVEDDLDDIFDKYSDDDDDPHDLFDHLFDNRPDNYDFLDDTKKAPVSTPPKNTERKRRQERIRELSAKNKQRLKRSSNSSRVQSRRNALNYNRKNSGLRNIRSLARQATAPGVSEAQRNRTRKQIRRAQKAARQRFDTNRRNNPSFSLYLDLNRFATFSQHPTLVLDLDRLNTLYFGDRS